MKDSYSRINTTAATLTKNRTEGSITPISGMCVTCVDGCIGMCEIGKSEDLELVRMGLLAVWYCPNE